MKTIFTTESYIEQQKRLPENGRHILAHHNDESIIVYQAYRLNIGNFAIKNGYFGGQFSFDRMTWIKTNFLWMMYRSKWGTKSGQEIVLAIRLKKSFFNTILSYSVPAIYEESEYKNKTEWKSALSRSPIRLQWDPDRDPLGNSIRRRAIQLGLKGKLVKDYAKEAILEIQDISSYVKSQRHRALAGEFRKVNIPKETIYLPENENILQKLGL